ncbi:MAG: hypothetical protein ACP5MT_02170 [Candidatus Acidifodinimicrobium sp.]
MVEIYDLLSNGEMIPVEGEYNKKLKEKLESLNDILADERTDGRKYKTLTFEGVMYHGTDVDGIKKLNASAYDNSMGLGVYLAKDRETAEKFAVDRYARGKVASRRYSGEPIVYELRTKRELNLLDLTKDENIKDIMMDFRMYLDYKRVRKDNAQKSMADRAMWSNSILDDMGHFVFSAFPEYFTKFLYDKGYDGIIHGGKDSKFSPFDEGVGTYTQIVVFNPNDVEIAGKYRVKL